MIHQIKSFQNGNIIWYKELISLTFLFLVNRFIFLLSWKKNQNTNLTKTSTHNEHQIFDFFSNNFEIVPLRNFWLKSFSGKWSAALQSLVSLYWLVQHSVWNLSKYTHELSSSYFVKILVFCCCFVVHWSLEFHLLRWFFLLVNFRLVITSSHNKFLKIFFCIFMKKIL